MLQNFAKISIFPNEIFYYQYNNCSVPGIHEQAAMVIMDQIVNYGRVKIIWRNQVGSDEIGTEGSWIPTQVQRSLPIAGIYPADTCNVII